MRMRDGKQIFHLEFGNKSHTDIPKVCYSKNDQIRFFKQILVFKKIEILCHKIVNRRCKN